MKYFTPELYARLQDDTSDAAMDGAEAAWDRVREGYRRPLKRVLPNLAQGLRLLVQDYYLRPCLSRISTGPMVCSRMRARSLVSTMLTAGKGLSLGRCG